MKGSFKKVLFVVSFIVFITFIVIGFTSFKSNAITNGELNWYINQERIYQEHAHNAAESFRVLGYSDDSDVIQLCKKHYMNSENNIKIYESMKSYPDYSAYFSESDVTMIAKTIYAEARGLNTTEQSKVAWCILNRVDKGWGSISQVVTARGQFAYKSSSPAPELQKTIARNVLQEWVNEKCGCSTGARTLGCDYIYFHGNGKLNIYRTSY